MARRTAGKWHDSHFSQRRGDVFYQCITTRKRGQNDFLKEPVIAWVMPTADYKEQMANACLLGAAQELLIACQHALNGDMSLLQDAVDVATKKGKYK